VPSAEELDQVPVLDEFTPGGDEKFIEPCAQGDLACLMPECLQLTEDELRCAEPRCLALVELTPEELERVDAGEEVPRFCTEPALPSFPLIVPEPSSEWLRAVALVALAALAWRKRQRAAPAS
jgi:hypothetical protein